MSLTIAYCIPSLDSRSGMERTLTIKANYFAETLNYKVYIILTDGKDRKPAFTLSDKIDIINLDINYDKTWKYPFYKKGFCYIINQRIYKNKLTRILNLIKPDITVSMLRREINFITKIKDGSFKIGEMHFNKDHYRDFNTAGSNYSIKQLFAKLWMAQLVRNLRKLDKFVVLSLEDMEKWKGLNNVTVIYNPIADYPEILSDCSSKKVVAAGRFIKIKGYDMLIDSWDIVSKKHSDWTLTIYGDGNKEEYVRQAADRNVSHNCFLNDAVTNLNEKFVESSIFVFSSRFEGFGMVITEAMACGLPPVSFACPCGPKDIIQDGINGILVEKGDVSGLADKISFLIENDEKRKEMGHMARERSERFRIDIIANEWDGLFRNLMLNKLF